MPRQRRIRRHTPLGKTGNGNKWLRATLTPGSDNFTRQNPDPLTKRPIRQLQALGHNVTLEPRQVAA